VARGASPAASPRGGADLGWRPPDEIALPAALAVHREINDALNNPFERTFIFHFIPRRYNPGRFSAGFSVLRSKRRMAQR
jgi:hypothetical protein